jgi:hypothetical protein
MACNYCFDLRHIVAQRRSMPCRPPLQATMLLQYFVFGVCSAIGTKPDDVFVAAQYLQ